MLKIVGILLVVGGLVAFAFSSKWAEQGYQRKLAEHEAVMDDIHDETNKAVRRIDAESAWKQVDRIHEQTKLVLLWQEERLNQVKTGRVIGAAIVACGVVALAFSGSSKR